MKILSSLLFSSVFMLPMCLPVMADDTAPIHVSYVKPDNLPDIQNTSQGDRDLALKSADFERFARQKVAQMNRNFRYSRSRMEVTRQPDGSYRARYHQVDNSSLSVKVSRSHSGSIPYVGVLSYREQILESTASSPDQLNQGLFTIVKIIPNRHIFSYQKGAWN